MVPEDECDDGAEVVVHRGVDGEGVGEEWQRKMCADAGESVIGRGGL